MGVHCNGKSKYFVDKNYYLRYDINLLNSIFRRTNRLEESKNIFDTIVNNQFFKDSSIILFLNKTDLLAEKLKSGETSIRWYFPEFSGDEKKLQDVQNFLLEFFR